MDFERVTGGKVLYAQLGITESSSFLEGFAAPLSMGGSAGSAESRVGGMTWDRRYENEER